MHRLTTYRFISILFLFTTHYCFAQQIVSKPFAGHTTQHEIHFWAMFKNADSVFIKSEDGIAQRFVFHKATSWRNFMPVKAVFTDLKPNTPYLFQYSFDGKTFLPLFNSITSDTITNDFSFLAGSCAYINTGFNGIIKPVNNLNIFEQMKMDSSEFMIWLGDNLYYITDQRNYKSQLKRNIKTRLNKKLSALLFSKKNYAIWDDHDYGSDNSGIEFKNKASSLTIFQQFWPNPVNENNNYYTFRQKDCQFFMLDDRYNNENNKSVLGQTQLEWLKTELLASNGTFKFICIGIQALNPVSNLECFYKTEKEYKSLIDFIKTNAISGVIFISGDRHHAELMQIKEEGLYPLYDFTTSPLSMYPIKISKKSREYSNPYKVAGTYFPSYNYGKISVNGPIQNRRCTIQLKDKNGVTVWTYSISENDLKSGK